MKRNIISLNGLDDKGYKYMVEVTAMKERKGAFILVE
jgi:hypothetical protein